MITMLEFIELGLNRAGRILDVSKQIEITLRLPTVLLDVITVAAKAEGLSRSAWIRKSLAVTLESNTSKGE